MAFFVDILFSPNKMDFDRADRTRRVQTKGGLELVRNWLHIFVDDILLMHLLRLPSCKFANLAIFTTVAQLNPFFQIWTKISRNEN